LRSTEQCSHCFAQADFRRKLHISRWKFLVKQRGNWSGESSGKILLELLLASFLTSFGIGGVLLALGPLKAITRGLGEQLPLYEGAELMKGMVERGLSFSEEAPFELPKRKHVRGEISFLDGSPLLRSSISRRAEPHPESDAFTMVRFEMLEAVRILRSESRGRSHWFLACSRFRLPLSSIRQASFALLLSDGMVELVGERRRRDRFCAEFTLRQERSMLFMEREAEELRFGIELIPLRDYFTLYVSRDRTLKLLQHRGERIVENQSLAHPVPRMQMSLKQQAVFLIFLDRHPRFRFESKVFSPRFIADGYLSYLLQGEGV
jgi:hypothetical protein